MKIERQLVTVGSKKDNVAKQLDHVLAMSQALEQQLRESHSLEEIEKQRAVRAKELTKMQAQVQHNQQQVEKSKEEIKRVEAQLLDKEFELREIENDKQIRTQDAKLIQILDELKKRCRGYLGQFYELVKPINRRYDLAVKVALGKCLKYLVVDTAATSRYLIDFLKEKGLQRDVLVLENFPSENREVQRIPAQRLKESGGEYIREVIETSRSNGQLQRAIDYFTSGRVVCKDF